MGWLVCRRVKKKKANKKCFQKVADRFKWTTKTPQTSMSLIKCGKSTVRATVKQQRSYQREHRPWKGLTKSQRQKLLKPTSDCVTIWLVAVRIVWGYRRIQHLHTKVSSHNCSETTSPTVLTRKYLKQRLLEIYFPRLPILRSMVDIQNVAVDDPVNMPSTGRAPCLLGQASIPLAEWPAHDL